EPAPLASLPKHSLQVPELAVDRCRRDRRLGFLARLLAPLCLVPVDCSGRDRSQLRRLRDALEVVERRLDDTLRADGQQRQDLFLVLLAEVRPLLAAVGLIDASGELALDLAGKLLGPALGTDLLGPSLTVGVVPADGPRGIVAQRLLLGILLKNPDVHAHPRCFGFFGGVNVMPKKSANAWSVDSRMSRLWSRNLTSTS